MQKHRVPGGFTLAELLAVIVLLAILGGMGLQPVMDWLAESRVENAARVVAGDLRLGIALAARQGTPVRLEFEPDALTYRFVDRASNQVLFQRSIGEGTELPIQSGSVSGSDLVVFPSRMTSGPLTVTLRAGRHVATVTMSSAAFVQVVEP